jgi:hypothetical protein
MHPAYTLYIGLEAQVTEWKNDVYNAINKAFTESTDVQNQVSLVIKKESVYLCCDIGR